MRPGPCLGLADPAAWPIISRSGRDHARSVQESLRKFSNLVTGWAVPFPLTLIRRDWTLFFVGFRSWRKRARWAWQKLNAAPSAIRIVVIAATVLAIFSATNLVYQVVRKPTEMLFPVSGAMNKMPAETWQQYAPLFREYSTATITPELLAALAQVEGAGNPVANLLAVAPDLESFRGPSTRLKRRRHVPDDRRSLRRSKTILHPPPHCRGGRLLVQWALYSRRAESRYRAHSGVFGPQGCGDSRTPTKRDRQPAAEARARRDHSSLRCSLGQGLCAPRLPSNRRRTLR